MSFNPLIPPWLGIALVLGTSRLLLAGACWHRRCFRPPPEVSRKSLHIALGTLFMALPWLFHEIWPVVGLCSIFIALLIARRVVPSIDCGVSGVIYGVERPPGGEFWFPAAVAALFITANERAVLFCAPLALLTYADAAAALIGSRYGTVRLKVAGGCKSLEGSFAFFVTALVCTQLSLNLLTPLQPTFAWLIALIIAGVSTFLELASPRGLDNFLVPLASSLLLRWLL